MNECIKAQSSFLSTIIHCCATGMRPIFLLIPLFLFIVCVYADTLQKKDNHSKYKIAIVGGGISGSFLSKYLVDYDVHCSLDITIFDPWIPKSSNNDTRNSDEIYDLSSGQGSRVSSWTFPDGRTVELGASVMYEGNRLVNEMIDGDPNLIKIPPYSTRSFNAIDDIIKHDEFGILHSRSAPWILNLSNMTSGEMKKTLLWRYNIDLYRMNRATQNALSSFQLIYDILDSNHEASFLSSPNDVWRAVGLSHAASVSFDEYLDDIGVSSQLSWWRKLLSEQGLLREELLTAINLNNNHQTNKEMTGTHYDLFQNGTLLLRECYGCLH
jgi:prenylcysteine oxidase/farnesylcysteine lyase